MRHARKRRWRPITGVLATPLIVAWACKPPEDPNPEPPEIEVDDPEFVWVAGPIEQDDLEELRGQACVSWNSPALPDPHVLEFVVDVSGSMNLPPSTGTEIKWHTTREALRDVVALLPETTSLGALYFPNRATTRNCLTEDEPCEPAPPLPIEECIAVEGSFPITPLGNADSKARLAFESGLDAVNPAGGTPTHDALNWAYSALDPLDDATPVFAILITDGQPTFSEGCVGSGNALEPVDEEPAVLAIQSAFELGVRTFVVGSPGSESNVGTGEDARPWLSRAAIAGGTASESCEEEGPDYCHFDLSDEDDFEEGLGSALDRILGGIAPCAFSIPEPDQSSVDPALVNVVLHTGEGDAEIIGLATSDSKEDPQESYGGAPSTSTCEEGWTWQRDGRLALCSSACDRLRSNAGARIELLFGCEAVPVTPPK